MKKFCKQYSPTKKFPRLEVSNHEDIKSQLSSQTKLKSLDVFLSWLLVCKIMMAIDDFLPDSSSDKKISEEDSVLTTFEKVVA